MPFFSQALAIYEAAYGPEHPATQHASKALQKMHQIDPQMMQQLHSTLPSPDALQPTPHPIQQHIRIGTRVRARGLVSAPQHNGCSGVVSSFDGTKQRYGVQLAGGKVLSLRPACMLQMVEVELGDAGQGMIGNVVRYVLQRVVRHVVRHVVWHVVRMLLGF